MARALVTGRVPKSARTSGAARVVRNYGTDITVVGVNGATATSTTLTVPLPSGVIPGDVLLVGFKGATAYSSGLATWASEGGGYSMYSKRAGVGEGSVAITFSGSGVHAASIIALRGVRPTGGVVDAASAATEVFSGTTIAGVNATPTKPRTLAVMFAGANTSGAAVTLTMPGSPWQSQRTADHAGAYAVGVATSPGPPAGHVYTKGTVTASATITDLYQKVLLVAPAGV